MAKILLVEDDSNLREIYGARLEAEGYEVAVAGDGEEGLAVAVKERPQLIIADVMMPKISGFDMLDILRTTPETKDVKVIVMTALSQEEDRKRGEELGADKYFVKSQVVLEDLVSTVKELLADVPGGAPAQASTPQPQAVAQPAPAPDDSAATTPVVDQAQAAPAPVPAVPVPEPAQPQNVEAEVADFVANDPLMNGTPPQPAAPQEPAPTDQQPPAPQA
jgi:CheY-like chemotaxis protein